MPPWNEIGYFSEPITTVHNGYEQGPYIQIAAGNPNRVALVISATGGGVSPDPAALAAGGGLTPLGVGPPLVIRESELGNLCTVAWYGVGGSVNATYTVIEVILREWPQQQGASS